MDGSGTPETGQVICRFGQTSWYFCRKARMSARLRSTTASLAGGAGVVASAADGAFSTSVVNSVVYGDCGALFLCDACSSIGSLVI